MAIFKFSGKSAIVTGAGSGIGKATAEYFVQCGAMVVFADLNEAAIEEAVQSLAADGCAIAFPYDAGEQKSEV